MKKIEVMKRILIFCLVGVIFLINTNCNANKSTQKREVSRILKVPKDFPTIAKAVEQSKDGDWIIISPGKYYENNIKINKAVTISSEWKFNGDQSIVGKTIIDPDDKTLFTIEADSVEVSGLKIINGNHTIDISSNVTIMHNHFINNLDALSFESGGGGYAGFNTIENDRDDGIDIDIVGSDKENSGGDILVEHNTIINSNDDGIEIRLFSFPDQNINYIIRENIIIGSKNAGIQLISYDEYTGKIFHIHHNIFRDCKTGLGCMGGKNTKEDLSGASKMDELVYFYNNTIIDNKMGATGGNSIVAMNNVVMGNELGGFKLFGKNSAVINNLFYQNGAEDFIGLDEAVAVSGNIFSMDPLINKKTFALATNSPCIDAGKDKYDINGNTLFEIASTYVAGPAPDIGASEFGAGKTRLALEKTFTVDAGEDMVLASPASELVLKGKIRDNSEKIFESYWKLEKGPGKVEILNPEKLESKVILHQQGIYQFSLTCTEDQDQREASDNIKVRYINEGQGKSLFLKEENNNAIEAEDFSYTYGGVQVLDGGTAPGNKFILLDADKNNNLTSVMEFSVGMAESNQYIIWFRVKSPNREEKKLLIEFNNKVIGEVPVLPSDDFHWARLTEKIATSPGQWQLLISNLSGKVFLDTILITKDLDYIPQ